MAAIVGGGAPAEQAAAAAKYIEFNFTVLGGSTVGKTSLCERLVGKTFSRKSSYKQSLEESASKYSIEVISSKGTILFNLFDWAWEEIRKTQNINQQLMRGSDGCIFLYDVNHRQSKSDFGDHLDFYQRAAGFEKPCLIVSNKNDSKKKAVQDGEGQALAAKGDKRGYCAISLADDTGIDDLVLAVAKLILADPNVSVSSFKAASPEILAWSAERASAKLSTIGLSMAMVKTHRVMVVVMNSSVVQKFTEMFEPSEFAVEAVMNASACQTELEDSGPGALPVACIGITIYRLIYSYCLVYIVFYFSSICTLFIADVM
jgi:small GTP-binding protein